ncbi:ATP-binding protein [Pedobacter metabolipauper]|uniref:histidine kinase n=1 Tax=Pedobacter metabolipauper TaxID=425513 RepID=A0A4R6SQA2_9SPHI|nr:tetratricopeptide repeat-containing sensor histidine kinase [Pedobacter metabolipauper]TDQ06931.1 signal transduction histidine kinase [Pedobacter metabolipauper]
MFKLKFLFLWLFAGIITIGCSAKEQPVQIDTPQVQQIKQLRNLALHQESKGDSDAAMDLHKKALMKSRIFGLQEQEARSLVEIARLLKNDDADESLKHLQNALRIAEGLNRHELKANIYFAIAGIYKQQRNYREALSALEAHQALLVRVFTKNKEDSIRHVKDVEERRLERYMLLTVIAFIMLTALVLAFYYIRTSRLNKALQSSNKIKDKLFSVIGHDLRGPAGGIMVALDMLGTGMLNENEEQEIIVLLKKQSQSFNETLNALLSWASTQLNGAETHITEFDPLLVINKAIATLEGQATQKNILLKVSASDHLTAIADPDHFSLIIRNILSNAIKFSHLDSTIEIDLELKGKFVVVKIADHGVGIPDEKKKHFLISGNHMESSFGTSGEKGTGLGLMLTKEFVRVNKGHIWLESYVGKGTTFFIDFPALI